MADIPSHADVIVIGGGPAGSLAATFLAQKGYDVVVLEKEKHPRYRVGESIIPHFWKFCDLAGVSERVKADGFIKKAGGTVVWNGVIRQVAFKDFGYSQPALHVERDRLDQIFFEHAREQGANTFEEVSVTRVDLDGEEATVSYHQGDNRDGAKITGRFVVDASGQNAVMARQLGIRVIDNEFRFMSIWGYFDNSKYVAPDGRAHPFATVRENPPTTFVTSVGEGGWSWHIPLRDNTSVGLVLPVEAIRGVKGSQDALQQFFLQTCEQTPYLSRLLEEARFIEGSFRVIRDYSYLPTQLAGPGYFLIGDAAAFVDPIFSVGVVLAMYGAYSAAWAIDRSLKNPDRTAHSQSVFSQQLRGRLDMARALALPKYESTADAAEKAQSWVRFETGLEQELMFVVSTMTTRSENFSALTQGNGEALTSSKFRVLDDIAF